MTCKRTKNDVSAALAIFYSCLSPGQHLYKMHSTNSPLGVLFDWLFTCVLFFFLPPFLMQRLERLWQ